MTEAIATATAASTTNEAGSALYAVTYRGKVWSVEVRQDCSGDLEAEMYRTDGKRTPKDPVWTSLRVMGAVLRIHTETFGLRDDLELPYSVR